MARKPSHKEKKLFKYEGGFIKSDVFHYDEDDKDEHLFVEVWGHIVRTPKVRQYNLKKTEFAIRYMRGGFIIAIIWGDTPAAEVAATLKQADMVCVRGIITRHQYVNKAGEHKETRFLNAFSVEPVGYTLFLGRLFRSPTIRKILEEDETDAFESLNDYVPEPEESEEDDLPFM